MYFNHEQPPVYLPNQILQQLAASPFDLLWFTFTIQLTPMTLSEQGQLNTCQTIRLLSIVLIEMVPLFFELFYLAKAVIKNA